MTSGSPSPTLDAIVGRATRRQGLASVRLEVGGFVPLTTIDLPGRLAAVVFCQGCPWRCRYCHNAHLIPRRAERSIDWTNLLRFLQRRKGLLDGVVFSGGEPLLQTDLPEAVQSVKALGYEVGLHTGGIYPKRLRQVLPMLDWIGLDIKALPSGYASLTRVPGSGDRAWESARLVLASGVHYEFRTTVHPSLLSATDLRALARILADMGVRRYVLQECVPEHCLDESLRCAQPGSGLTVSLVGQIKDLFHEFSVRRA